MEKSSTMPEAVPLFAGDAWFDPIEAELRERVRQFLEEMIEQEATAALGRGGTSAARLQAVGMERERGGCLGRSVRSRSPCRAPGCRAPKARPGSGRARCCRATPG